MPFLRFYGHFAAAYGTIWLIFVLSIAFNGHAETGEFGLYGFPVIALVYALLRLSITHKLFSDFHAQVNIR